MKYLIETNLSEQLANIEIALKILDPNNELTTVPPGFPVFIHGDQESATVRVVAPQLDALKQSWECRDEKINDPRYTLADQKRRLKELVRLGIMQLLGEGQQSPPWGILSGVRPTKIYHYLRSKGFSFDETREQLTNWYSLAPSKVDLLLQVGSLQESFFKPPEYIGVYLGIPFCPSLCHYCSFPSVSLQTHSHLVRDYLHSFYREIEAVSELCRELHLKVETIYVGGGTPTSLGEADFAQMIQAAAAGFKSATTVEFTVEAGRPETITPEKIRAMAAAGVTRVSINPQTMQALTLERIGRNHTVADIYAAVEMLRQTSEIKLNMDLIQGLPGETGVDFWDSLQKVLALEPDNITVHTLARKRAAQWHKEFYDLDLLKEEELIRVNQEVSNELVQRGYHPYYLYRQRQILANLENTGYAKPGQESIYNIQMMEERQTIMGIGAGAITKWLTGGEPELIRYQNPKCPATYIKRLAEDLTKKAYQTRILLG